jgi:predicted dehydrogenase
MLKVGVLGAGHLGKIHLRLLHESEKYQLVGFYDPHFTEPEEIENTYACRYFEDYDELLRQVDVVDVVTPTLTHYEMTEKAIKNGKHVFIEKPITDDQEEAASLSKLIKEHSVKGQVGHVERFNPAFQAVKNEIDQPKFIETHRLAEFNPRGTDVPVVLDLMIHDIDIILSCVRSSVKEVHASGVAVISDTPDIANARLVFENNCVANLTASRISLKNMRKSRFFQQDAYISVDFLMKKSEIVKMKNAPEEPGDFDMILQNAEGKRKQIYFDNPYIEANNAIFDELNSFADSIDHDTEPEVTFRDATNALAVAKQIIDKFDNNHKL